MPDEFNPPEVESKIFKDKFFVIDFENILRCYSIKDGSELWNVKTESSFIKSQKKLSLIISDKKVVFNNSFWTGASLRTDKSLIALLGFQTGVLHIAYSFDYSFMSIGQYSSGTHEISVGLNLPDPRNRRHIYYLK